MIIGSDNMAFLIGVIIIVLFIVITYLVIKNKIRKYFGKSILEIIHDAKIEDQELPKSLSSMDSIYLEQIKKDFPQLNINELKREAEKIILDSLNSIENKRIKNISNDKIRSFVKSQINDLKTTKVNYDSIKIHKTVISKYENNNGIATIYFGTSLEYLYLKDNKLERKIQDRFKTEFIYVIDENIVPKDKKLVGINCPNCGAPIKDTKKEVCQYCQTKIISLPKRVWVCNDIIRY